MFPQKSKFYEDWCWLADNYDWALLYMDIEVVKVCPKTKRIMKDESRNTLLNYWLETGEPEEHEHRFIATHDPRLDCGGDSFEEAICNLARKIKKYYKKTESYSSSVRGV
jgi:hypothetical protein